MRGKVGVAAGIALLIGAVSCGGDTVTETSDASCAFVVYFRDQLYDAVTVKISPEEGEPLGVARLPGCDDTNDGEPEPDEEIPVSRFPGVSPDRAVIWTGSHDTVFVREGTERVPPELGRLLEAPSCDEGDAPITLNGPWLGILGADGNTELDLEPPYDIDLFVDEASSETYERAYLTVRVPPAAGQPLTRDDVKASLWEGGTIELTTNCDGGRFVALTAEAHPPE